MHARFTSPALILTCCLTVAVASSSARAQGQAGMATQVRPYVSAANYYYVSKPGEATMEVNIWGSVRTPGRYEISTSADLLQLISFAGGPTTDASMDDVRITRLGHREGAPPDGMVEFTVDLTAPAECDKAELTLRPGDIVFVDASGWVTARDLLMVITAAALVVTAASQVMIATQ